MELTRTDSVARGDTLTAYDFAMEEVTGASSKLAHALLARTLKSRRCRYDRAGVFQRPFGL